MTGPVEPNGQVSLSPPTHSIWTAPGPARVSIDMPSTGDEEIDAVALIAEALRGLPPLTAARVLDYHAARIDAALETL